MKLKGLDKILLFAARAKAAANAADIAVIETNVGDLTDLDTTDKSNLVDALNETYAKAGSNTASIGDLTALDTTDKSNLVDALNETYNIAVGYSSDGLKEDVSTLQDEVEVIESAIRQINPTGAATATVTSFDTVNSLPVNAAQAGLGVVQEGMTATNLTDGDFSATGDWTSDFATFTVASGVASLTADAQNQNIQQALNAIATHVYYVKALIKLTTGSTDVALRFNDGTDTTDTATASSTAWQKVSALITAGASGVGYIGIVDKRAASWDLIQVKEVSVINLTAIAKQAATLSQADAMLLDYFSGTQSAVTGRVRSVGKNLFDGQLESGTIDTSGVNAVDATKIRSKNFTKVKPSVGYILSNGSSYTALTASFYDKNKVFISQSAVNYATFTTPALTQFIRFQTTGTNINALIQLELGSTATTYEAYRKTESYTKPMPLYRVPNSVADTAENGDGFKRVQRYVLQAVDFTSTLNGSSVQYVYIEKPLDYVGKGNTKEYGFLFTGFVNGAFTGFTWDNVENINQVSTQAANERFMLVVALGTYADIAAARAALKGTVIYYQLATPIITENVSSGTLLAYPSGTVYWEPVIADVAIYATGASILNTGYPISSLESIYKIDLVTGEQTPLAVASATVASGGLSFTHTGLIDGDLVGFTYYFAHALPYGENDYTYYNAVSEATYTKGVKTDLVEPNDFTVTTGAEKTLVLATPVYNDIIIQGLNLRVGATPPTLAAFQDSIYAMKFIDGQTDIVYDSFELPHDYKEGTDLELHLHWSPSTTDTGDCVFNFAYTIAGVNGTFGAEAVKTFTQAGSGTVNKHQYVSGNTVISGTGLTIGTIIVFALSRPTGDSFTGDAFLHSVGVHYQIDTIGSRTAAAK